MRGLVVHSPTAGHCPLPSAKHSILAQPQQKHLYSQEKERGLDSSSSRQSSLRPATEIFSLTQRIPDTCALIHTHTHTHTLGQGSPVLEEE